jgi:uncharacterized protein YcgI (DUF1989 family)
MASAHTTNPPPKPTPPPSTAPPATRAAYHLANPPPPPIPAYLSTTHTTSPLKVDPLLYSLIQTSPRYPQPLTSFTLPIRSGRAFPVPAGAIFRISTPLGPQVGDLNLWSLHNPRERFWASRTRQLHASHLTTGDRLWSNLPYLRPLATIIADSLGWYCDDGSGTGQVSDDGIGKKRGFGGRCHDLLGTRCDPYVNVLLSGEAGSYDYHCHSNLTRAILPFGLNESDVHDVLNIFQITGLDSEGRYFMQPSPAQRGDYIEFLAETDLLVALSTCPGGDLSVWGFGRDEDMREVCRPLKVEVWALEDEGVLEREGWKESQVVRGYKGNHGMNVPLGESQASMTAV